MINPDNPTWITLITLGKGKGAGGLTKKKAAGAKKPATKKRKKSLF